MHSKRALQLTLCALLAALITIACVWMDLRLTGAHQKRIGLVWARQVASQVEALTLKAREARERDPIGWAVNYLAQGAEPRLLRLSKAQESELNSQPVENYAVDRESGSFEYFKLL